MQIINRKFGETFADEFFVPTPEGHGWTITDVEIRIKWMNCKPAPEEVSALFFYERISSISLICRKCLRVEENDNRSKKGQRKQIYYLKMFCYK